MTGFSQVAEPRLLAWYTLAGLVTMATWTQLDAIGMRALLPIAIVFAIERWPSFWHAALAETRWLKTARLQLFPGRPQPVQIVIGVVVCLPLLVHLAATLGEEFPYGGDEGYHFSATRTYVRYLIDVAPWLAALAIGIAALRRVHRRWLATIAMVALWALSVRVGPEVTFARYPAAFYLLAAPINMLGEVARAPNPHVGNHVMNTLSVLLWLFVLRPIVVRRWPDLPSLVVGLMLFYQPTVLTYFGGGGLEPLSIILLLVALEAAVRLPPEDCWVAVLVAGCASWVKEPAILFLPIVWVIAMVDWAGFVPRLRPGAIPLGIAAGTPFVVYYFVRHTIDLPRFYALLPLADLASSARAREWLDRMHQQFGDSGLVLLAALPVFAVAGAVLYRRSAHLLRAHLLLYLIALALVVMFYVEVQGVPYTGYGRYLAFPYAAVAIAVLLFVQDLVDRGRTRAAAAIAVFVFACQAQPLAAALAQDFLPDYMRNAREWHRCLIRLPFRQFAQQIASQPGGDAVTRVRLVTITLDTLITRVAYPDVAERYTIVPAVLAPDEVNCRCGDAAEAVVAGFEYRANFDAGTPPDPRVANAERACVEQMQSTCRTVAMERAADGAITGALGIGVR